MTNDNIKTLINQEMARIKDLSKGNEKKHCTYDRN